jgi:hypothetical protein
VWPISLIFGAAPPPAFPSQEVVKGFTEGPASPMAFSLHSQQLLKGSNRVAQLAPKHAAGRSRRVLKAQAALGFSSFGGQRVMSRPTSLAPSVQRTAGRSGKLVVKAMWVEQLSWRPDYRLAIYRLEVQQSGWDCMGLSSWLEA